MLDVRWPERTTGLPPVMWIELQGTGGTPVVRETPMTLDVLDASPAASDAVPSRRLRVCIVTHTLVRTDGQGRINYEAARYLASQGHDVQLVSTTIAPDLRDADHVTWHEVPVPDRLPTNLLKYQVFATRSEAILRKLQREAPIDIVQLNGCITNYPADVNVAMFVHSNWIRSRFHSTVRRDGARAAYHQLFTRLNAAWEKRSFRTARRCVALSGIVRQSLIEDVNVHPELIEVIEPGVDADEFRPLRTGEPNKLRELIGVSDDAFVLMFAGDLKSNRKNLDLVLEAQAKLPADTHLVCAGNFAGSPYLPVAERMGLTERVHFIGKRSDLGELFRGADVFAFPSHYDTFALVVTEAMAAGLPVITAPSAGAATFVEHEINGILLPDSGDLEAMTAALSRMHADRAWTRRLGAAARATAERLTWTAMAKRYERMYQEIVSGKSN